MRLLLSLRPLTRSTVSLRSFLKRRSWPVESSSEASAAYRSVLQAAELLVQGGNLVEGFQHLGLERRFHRGERQIAFVVEIVGFRGFGIGLGLRFGGIEFLALGALRLGLRGEELAERVAAEVLHHEEARAVG